MSTKELLLKAFALSAENPELEVKVMVGNEFADEFGSTEHEFCRVEIGLHGSYGDRIYCDEDDLIDVLLDEMDSGSEGENIKMAKSKAKEILKKTIIIWTQAT